VGQVEQDPARLRASLAAEGMDADDGLLATPAARTRFGDPITDTSASTVGTIERPRARSRFVIS
jgi:hypothetical protein